MLGSYVGLHIYSLFIVEFMYNRYNLWLEWKLPTKIWVSNMKSVNKPPSTRFASWIMTVKRKKKQNQPRDVPISTQHYDNHNVFNLKYMQRNANKYTYDIK